MPSGLRPATGGEGRRENVQTENKTYRLVAEMALSVVRKNPQEPAQTRGSRQKKANRLGLAFKVLVVECGPGFKSTLTTHAASLRRLSPYCGYCPFHITKSTSERLSRGYTTKFTYGDKTSNHFLGLFPFTFLWKADRILAVINIGLTA